ncbi:serine O-acetyltransferase [Neobacillus vireti]|uniref:serine O-acetyltransferase n=1 Tax=Neobacillus vireti TaxID=220686 RepID=UPI003B585D98
MLNYIFQDFKTRKFSSRETFGRVIVDRGCSAVLLYRVSSWCWHHKLKLCAIIFKQFNILLNSCDIAYQAEIGSGFRIYHGVGIVLAPCQIGENFSIYQNVTIGRNIKSNINGRFTPIIGNNCEFYTGCVVAGPIEIGDNVRIGANAVVMKDIPSNSTAVGVPAKVI